MSGNNVSVTETGQSDQYLPANATHQYYRYYNHKHVQPPQQQQQPAQQSQSATPQPCQRHILPHTPLQQHKQQLHWQHQQQLQQQHQQLSSNSSEFDEFHWPSKQPHGQGSRIYITPADIPPPPPQPHSSNSHSHHNGHKRYHQQQQQQQQSSTAAPRHAATAAGTALTPTHRCKCDHPIELLGYDDITGNHHQQRHGTPNYYYKATAAASALGSGAGGGLGSSSGSYQLRRHSAKLHDAMLDEDELSSAVGMARFKNLVYSKEKKRKVRIILSIVAAIVVVALLAVALVFILDTDDDADDDAGNKNGDAINLEDILSGQLYARRFNGSWSNDANLIYRDGTTIIELNTKTQSRTVLLADASEYVLYEKSADGQLLLLAKNYKKHFRYSFLAEYDIYNFTSRATLPLLIKNEQRYLSMVQWSPVGNALIINYDRNLYYKPSPFEAEITITSDENIAFLNGVPDWVYEEEVFSSNVATWFNPTGTQIAFIRFDDSPTQVINFPYYGDAGDLRYQYPLHQVIAYPKAGSPNPRVQLFIVDLKRAVNGDEFTTEMPVPSGLNTETDYIITVVSWLNETHMLSVWMNRIQNSAYVMSFDGLNRKVLYSAESKTGWVDLYTAPFKNRNASRIAFVLPSKDYKHVSLLSTSVSNAEQQQPDALTQGNYVVDNIMHWDGAHDIIFYTANTEQHPEQMHLYAIRGSYSSSRNKPEPKCLTCKLVTSDHVEQTYFSATFNDNNQIIISSLGPGVPTTSIYEWSYANSQVTLTKLMDWETNEALRGKLKGLAMPTREIHTFNIEGGFTAKVLLQLPPNMDRSGHTKYPMLVDVYGGPDSFSVTDKWIVDWGTYLSSNQSVIYAKIDGRGSGLRGEKLLHAIYLKLGTVEISDQITVAHNLTEAFKFVDAEHIGIWGWSYGGYAAAMALANDDDGVFRCAASIAPVTDWTYYDSIYTERYMGLPVGNEQGYANSRLSTRAQKLRGKKYLLVHGTLDDNVHYQQAMILAKNLERHDILFKQISYADEDHGLSNVRPHLYHSLDRFFGECFASKRLMKSAK